MQLPQAQRARLEEVLEREGRQIPWEHVMLLILLTAGAQCAAAGLQSHTTAFLMPLPVLSERLAICTEIGVKHWDNGLHHAAQPPRKSCMSSRTSGHNESGAFGEH